MTSIASDIKKSMGTEEEPFEGEVDIKKVQEAILEMIQKNKESGKKITYLFSSWNHKSATDFLNFMVGSCGIPNFLIHSQCDKKTVEDRYKKKNEVEEISQDVSDEIDASHKIAEKMRVEIE